MGDIAKIVPNLKLRMEAKAELKYIFSNINDLLKFGEAKHGGLLVLNSALVIGIISSYGTLAHLTIKPILLLGIISFGLSVSLSIISQFPITHNIIFDKKDLAHTNIYFYGHLAQIDFDQFIATYKLADSKFDPNKFDIDLINQILVNSRIARAKFIIFKFASYCTAFGFGIIGLSTIIKIIWHF